MTLYDSLPSRDQHRDEAVPELSRSSTEVDGSLMGEDIEELDQSWNGSTKRRARTGRSRNKIISKLQSYRSLLDTILLVIIIFLLLLLLLMQRETATSASSCSSSSSPSSSSSQSQPQSSSSPSPELQLQLQLGGDFTALSPAVSTSILKFSPDFSFVPSNASGMFSSQTLSRWRTLMPKNSGWSGPTDKTFFTTSMTHSLHCLFMMARTYAAVVDGETGALPADHHRHFFHCVDYVRQGVMCAGDIAMEGHLPQESSDFGPLDGGWNAHHVCKDYDQVLSFLDEQIEQGVRMVLPIDD
ncbi:hypothetical protein MKZ38_000621 [Zalerion maritima]|uniref:Oxidase ustYa n=1 Tax=Zalerion maritima TaxID=339359 RepID=A0AAD5RJ68_9PEZI|nr:hypothetical protein MKZ38_000621 [Zalerion maritima]